MTNNTDMPLLKPIKAIINEQVTAMYTFQNEIRLEIKQADSINSDVARLVDSLLTKVNNLQLS